MASIYFYYNELLRQSADQAAMSGKNCRYGQGEDEDSQQQEVATDKSIEKKGQRSSSNPAKKENQFEDGALKTQFSIHTDTEAALAALQPRMNRLAYLQTAGAANLDALARSLGPKL